MSFNILNIFKLWLVSVGAMCVLGQIACSDDSNDSDDDGKEYQTDITTVDAGLPQDPGRPEGWTEESHGPDSLPNYDMVFAQDQVKRIDVEIAPADWQVMLDDMTETYGEFGSGSQFSLRDDKKPMDFGFEIPPSVTEACQGKELQESCVMQIGEGEPVPGNCFPVPMAEGMICIPSNIDEIMEDMGMDADRDGERTPEENPVWVPCTIRFEGKAWNYVGVRFKGQSTLAGAWGDAIYKLPFKLDFDQFETEHPEVLNQRFYGVKRLSLANNMFDNSYLREKVAADLYREGGVPTAHGAFYRVYFNTGEGAQYIGLYTASEVPERAMFVTQFGGDGGNLYKPRLGLANWAQDTIVDEMSFSKKTNEKEADFSDMQNAIAALHAPRDDAATWRKNLEALFDADGFMRWLAVNTVIQNWDSYGNMSQNCYLYGDPSVNGRLSWIPWDHNLSLSSEGQLGLPPLPLDMSTVGDDWPLIRYLFDDPVYSQAYWKYVEEFTNGPFALDVVIPRLQKEYELIKNYVLGPEGEQAGYSVFYSTEGFLASLDELIAHVTARHQAVQEALQSNKK